MIRKNIAILVMLVSIVFAIVFSGVVMAEKSGCTNIRDLVDITDGEEASTNLSSEEMKNTSFYDDESDRFVITGSNRQWVRFACAAFTN
jgi:hypothetical protein